MSTGHLFQHLTREEWKLCFVLAFSEASDTFTGAYPLEHYASPGLEGRSRFYEELFRRAIRFLTLQHGYIFRGLNVFDNGEIEPAALVEPRNIAYVAMMRQGDLPDLPLAIEEATFLARRHVKSLPLGPLHAMNEKIQSDLAKQRAFHRQADPDGDINRELNRLREAGMSAIGMVKEDDIVH